jgi:hypothetical protein
LPAGAVTVKGESAAERDVFVVVCLPAGLQAAFGEDRVGRLVAAHPRAEVVVVADPHDSALTAAQGRALSI